MIDKEEINKLSKKYGSPFFLINEAKIKGNIDRFRKSFSNYKGKFTLGYSTKTNPQVGILKVMKKYSVTSECASYLDLASSHSAGYKGEEMVYAGLHKPISSLEYAIDKNIDIINIESIHEAKNLKQILESKNKTIKVGVRIGFSAKSGIKSILGVTYDRFGASTENGEAREIIDYLIKNKKYFELVGLHCHPGSNIKNPKKYFFAIDELEKLSNYIFKKYKIKIKLFNIGGGIGIKEVYFYSPINLIVNSFFRIFKKRPSYNLEAFDQKKMLDKIVEYLNKKFSKHDSYPEVMMEPGRALIGNAIDLNTKVVNIKKTKSGNWLIVDAGTNLLSILTLFTEFHKFKTYNNSNIFKKYSIAGPLLYSSDVIVSNICLPTQNIGDTINICDVGAYFNSQSSHFLFARCATLIKTIDSEYNLVERKEEFEDIVKRSY